MNKGHLRLALPSLLSVVLLATSAYGARKNPPPVVTSFVVEAESTSPVPINSFDASDPNGSVAAFMVTETTTPPSASAGGWSGTKPQEYATSRTGLVELCGWAKDNLDAVSKDPVCVTR